MEWPTTEHVKRRLGITIASDELEADVSRALAAAIEIVRGECTYAPPAELGAEPEPVLTFTDTDESRPARVSEAALLLAIAGYKAPDAPHGVAGIFDTAAIYVAREHPQIAGLLRGYRADFGIA